MNYLITFLEGTAAFLSPCLLPMIPVYIAFFAGRGDGEKGTSLRGALGFVLGFTALFTLMGAFAGTLGSALRRSTQAVNLVGGIVIILFGLGYLGVFRPGFLLKGKALSWKPKNVGFFQTFLFGLVFAAGWTPCVGAFLGSALMLAASKGSRPEGIALLLCFSAGLGVPFLLCALFLSKLKQSFDFIKRHYEIVNRISGWFLIAVGLLMATGLLNRFLIPA